MLSTYDTPSATMAVPPRVVADLQFTGDGVAFGSGCNRGHCAAELTATEITFGPVGLTRMLCIGPTADVETAVLRVIRGNQTVRYHVVGDLLRIHGPAGTLEYRKAPHPEV